MYEDEEDIRELQAHLHPCDFERISWCDTTAECGRCHRPAACKWKVDRFGIDIHHEHLKLVEIRVSVHHCDRCGHYFRRQPPFLRPWATYMDRVVAKAVDSVFVDGMPVTKVVERMARDFWVRPSESMIRHWCRQYTDGLSLENDYQQWVAESFSGILCVDEVYQGRFAVLLAVDPAAPDGDRLVAYELLSDTVREAEMEAFLSRLERSGLSPDEVVTDGSPLYPSTIARVWPETRHQLCLFHQTRRVTKAILKVISSVAKQIPDPVREQSHRGAIPQASPVEKHARELRVADVHRLKNEGVPIREIARRTGHSRNTVRAWLRNEEPRSEVLKEVYATSPSERSTATTLSAPDPPEPWRTWDEVRDIKEELSKGRYLFVTRPERLNKDQQETLQKLIDSPIGPDLRTARRFMEQWFAIWRDNDGNRRTPEEAKTRFEKLRDDPDAASLPALRRTQRKMDDGRFEALSAFLEEPTWEATSNGAERVGRVFRHLQAARFLLRTGESIDGILKAWAVQKMNRSAEQEELPTARSNRGRRTTNGQREPPSLRV